MVDLKILGRSLAESGLMHRTFSSMGEQEVRMVASLVHSASKKPCIHCDQWQALPEHPWWIGQCRIDGHELQKTSFCNLQTDGPPF